MASAASIPSLKSTRADIVDDRAAVFTPIRIGREQIGEDVIGFIARFADAEAIRGLKSARRTRAAAGCVTAIERGGLGGKGRGGTETAD